MRPASAGAFQGLLMNWWLGGVEGFESSHIFTVESGRVFALVEQSAAATLRAPGPGPAILPVPAGDRRKFKSLPLAS